MAHPRKTIRNKVVSILMDATNAGENVFSSRVRAISPDNLPALNVQTYEESAQKFNETRREYRRTLKLGIGILARAQDDLDDQLDDIAEQIEQLILDDETLDNTVEDTLITGTDMRIELGDNSIGGMIIEFDVIYHTEHQQDFDDLEGLHITLKNGPDSDVHSETTITIETEDT